MKNKIISLVLVFVITFIILLGSSGTAFAETVKLDSDTFNELVNRAKEADILEEEKDFYKTKYEELLGKTREIQDVYKESAAIKEEIIRSQIDLSVIQKSIIQTQGETIYLQDKKLNIIQTRSFLTDMLIIGMVAAGVSAANKSDDDGLAIGIATTGITYFVFR